MRLDNNRGFFSPEQKLCRIPISPSNMFCVTKASCYRNWRGTKAQPGERENSSPGPTCAAFPGSCDQTPASISHPCFEGCWLSVSGEGPPCPALPAVLLQPHPTPSTDLPPALQPGPCPRWEPRLGARMLCPHPTALLLPVISANTSARSVHTAPSVS